MIFSISRFLISGSPAARWGTNRSTITIGTETRVCIEIESNATLFSWSTRLSLWSVGGAPYDDSEDDDDVPQHGNHTPVNRSMEAYVGFRFCMISLKNSTLSKNTFQIQ